MGSTIVTKRPRTPASQQHPNVISSQTRDLAMGNGLSMAHSCLLALLDIGENYAKSALSTETMRSTVIDFARDAADGSGCLEDICNRGIGHKLRDAEARVLGEAHQIAQKAAETIERLHEFFYKDHGEHLQAMDPDVIGNVILGMVKPAGIHLERAMKILGYDKDVFTSEFGEAAAILSEPAPAAEPAAAKPNDHAAALEALDHMNGDLLALEDVAKQMDLWPCGFITLGDMIEPLVNKLEADTEKFETVLLNLLPGADTAKNEVMKALEYIESLQFVVHNFLTCGQYDEAIEWNNPFTKDQFLGAMGGSIAALVYRIAYHRDRAIVALGGKTSGFFE